MPRNMSFMLTTNQVKNRTKTVTRRLGWWFIKSGDILNACGKCQGLKKGEKIKKICQIRIISTNPEPLYHVHKRECMLEGFPSWTPGEFIEMFCEHNKCKSYTEVNRIEFEYI